MTQPSEHGSKPGSISFGNEKTTPLPACSTPLRKASFRILLLLLTLQLPLQIVIGYLIEFNYLSLVISFSLIPILDFLLGENRNSLSLEKEALLQEDWFYPIIPRLWVPVQLGIFVWGAYVVTYAGLPPGQWIAFVLSISIMGGAGIVVAHELGHQRNVLEQTLAKLLLASVGYIHFVIEHNRGHHSRVATPEDPASAPMGISYYRFWPRTVVGSWRSSWRIEAESLVRKGFPAFSVRNQMLWFRLLPLLIMGGLWGAFGVLAVGYYLLQSFMAFSFLEAINYIQHYGLQRKELTPGQYEPVSPRHSWETNHRLSNLYLLQLGRHADHHLHPARRYPILRHCEDSPQLPFGYPTMILLALLPPLWFALMNPRVALYASED